ncbi:MAG: potassium transporter TrkA [Symploca sp. SIO2B6]|nr:potassium transporter TrkA [Symploca sp. SIO2B6]
MGALTSLLIVITLSLLITRIGTEALTLTGLSRESAQFQSRSAFTGAGFTTSESEQVVSHPVRRRILMLLMMLGNAGIVTVVSSLVLTFISAAGPADWLSRLLLLMLGIAFLWVLANNRWVNRILSRIVSWSLQHWTDLDLRDYTNLLRLSGEYGVMELKVQPEDWLANKRLVDTHLRSEGALVLGIQRADKTYIGAPRGSTCICAHDILIIYGRLPALKELDSRRAGFAGEQAHWEAVAMQQRLLKDQSEHDLVSHLDDPDSSSPIWKE